ncbi:MAG: hypothetical protein ABI591_08965 [Kofleriaceae bacterium]
MRVVVPTERGYWKRMTGLFVLCAAIANELIAGTNRFTTVTPRPPS